MQALVTTVKEGCENNDLSLNATKAKRCTKEMKKGRKEVCQDRSVWRSVLSDYPARVQREAKQYSILFLLVLLPVTFRLE